MEILAYISRTGIYIVDKRLVALPHITFTHYNIIVVQFCELLLDPMNGTVNTTDTLEGTVAGYSCMQGYILIGNESRVCQRNVDTLLGVWSGTEPTCISKF